MAADRVSSSVSPPAEVLLSKRVQEMVLTGQDPFGPYVYGQTITDPSGHQPYAHIPTAVDLQYFFDEKRRLLNDDEKAQAVDELKKLKTALSTWGCFQAIGHGIPRSLLDDIRRVGREFFEQPMEERNKYAKSLTEFEGYGADPMPEQGQPLDWSDRIFLELVPEDQRDYKFWPEKPSSFKKVLEEYSEKIHNLTEAISKATAKSLGIGESRFVEQFGGRARLQGRFNYYPPCKNADAVLGLKAHSDGSGYTVITEDGPGLQILKDGEWHAVSDIDPYAVLVLMGDQMEIMSNGMFVSPMHRVVADRRRDRVSAAVFYYPAEGKEVAPEEVLISEETPTAFKKVKDYGDLHIEYYNKGMRALNLVRT